MAHSPTEAASGDLEEYRSGWKAVVRLTQEGLSWSGREANCVFWNRDGREFSDVSGASGLDFKDDGRGAAVVDWDFDGRLDLWLTNRTAPQVRFLHNVAPADGSFLALRLRGTSCNRDAIGARVELELEGSRYPRLIRTLHAGEGYLSQSSKWVHFGFPQGASMGLVRVRWPGGEAEEFRGLEPDQRYELVQGSGQPRPWSPGRGALHLEPSTPVVPGPTERSRLLLNARVELPELQGECEDGPLPLVGDAPVLVNLWASWCKPCLGELADLAPRSEELSGLRLIALSVDEEKDRPAARAYLEQIHWPFEQGYAPPELLDTLDVLQRSLVFRRRRLPLPTSFLINARRELVAVYKGPVEAKTILADLALGDASPEELRRAVATLGGRWLSDPPPPTSIHGYLARELLGRGLYPQAAEFQLMVPRPEGGRDDDGLRVYQVGLLSLAQSLVEQAAFEPAARLLERAAAVDPGEIEIRLNLAACLVSAGKATEAESAYRQVLEQRPNNAAARRGLAELLIRTQRPAEAVEVLETMVAARSELAWPHWLLAQAWEALGKGDQALSQARRALEIDPGLAEAQAFVTARGEGGASR